MPPSDPRDWIALNRLPGVGPILLRRLLDRHPDPAEIAFRLPADAFLEAGRGRAIAPGRLLEARRSLAREAHREARLCRRHGIRVVPLTDPDYPAALRELPDGPVLLYQRGELPPARPRLAMVGSRSPTRYGVEVAERLADGLARRGYELVSGGARGIDRRVHEAALASGGRTVAVLGSGLLRPYPPEHETLFASIADRGALLSEFPLETGPHPGHFPRRNRLISGLAAGVIVVEAATRSGSLSTAGHALEQGREVYAVPGPVTSLKSEGCHRLIQQGAKLVLSLEDVLDELSPMFVTPPAAEPSGSGPQGRAGSPVGEPGLTADERDVLQIVARTGPIQLDDLALEAPFGIARLQAALFGLEIRGSVEQWPGRYYVLRPRKEP